MAEEPKKLMKEIAVDPLFLLYRSISPTVPYYTVFDLPNHSCFPDFKLDLGVASLPTDLHHLDLSFAPTPLYFLL